MVPATVSFVDIAGIVRGASEGEGLGNQFLANIREADAICMVTRAFEDPDVTHVDGRIEPAGDIETIATELILADIQTLEKAIPRLEKEVRGKKTEAAVLETARAALAVLGEGIVLSAALASGAAAKAGIDGDVLSTFQLMTTKPIIYVFNMDDAGMNDEAKQAELRELVATAGEKESRAWTIRKGMTAPQAAGVIHTDFERGFIKAEIVSYDDLMEYGGVAEVRAHGRVRMEGKDYVMQDGDVVEFRFNV